MPRWRAVYLLPKCCWHADPRITGTGSGVRRSRLLTTNLLSDSNALLYTVHLSRNCILWNTL
jgi:hypothetical protein